MSNLDFTSSVVLLCGISGSGKTTLARRLQQKGYRRLSTDAIVWSQHGKAFDKLPHERQTEIFAQANRELLITFERAIAKGEKIVVDTTLCHREQRDTFRQLCTSFGIEPQLVYLRATYNVLAQRLAYRDGSEPDNRQVSAEQLATFCRNFEVPSTDESPIIIDQH